MIYSALLAAISISHTNYVDIPGTWKAGISTTHSALQITKGRGNSFEIRASSRGCFMSEVDVVRATYQDGRLNSSSKLPGFLGLEFPLVFLPTERGEFLVPANRVESFKSEVARAEPSIYWHGFTRAKNFKHEMMHSCGVTHSSQDAYKGRVLDHSRTPTYRAYACNNIAACCIINVIGEGGNGSVCKRAILSYVPGRDDTVLRYDPRCRIT